MGGRGSAVRVLLKALAGAFAILAVVFALANREPVTVALSPLPVGVDLPLYLLVLLALVVGVAIGGASGWLAAGRRRRAARESRREAAALRRDLDDLKQARPPAEPSAATLPAPRRRA
jgi:uncharacterized integral membrane protein